MKCLIADASVESKLRWGSRPSWSSARSARNSRRLELQLDSGLVEWILWVWFKEEVLEPVIAVDGQHWLPVLAEDVEAHVPSRSAVRVVDLVFTLHLWGFVGYWSPFWAKWKLAVSRNPSSGLIFLSLKLSRSSGSGKICFAGLRQLKLVNILCYPEVGRHWRVSVSADPAASSFFSV